jgi:ribonucleoside-diphosphate reductase alpha chain
MMHHAREAAMDRLDTRTNGHNGHTETKPEALRVEPFFCPAESDPFDTVDWELRTAQIKDENGEILFEQTDCEIPTSWSPLATNVVVSKYFYGEPGTEEREKSVRQVIHRVARTIADWGIEDGYFESTDDGEAFYRELAWLCLHQHGAFNSPVWFNVGLYHEYGVKGSRGNYNWNVKTGAIQRPETPYEYPQSSACFIQSVEDNMEDIMRLAKSEAMLFKFGSGTGTDLSTLRSSKEKLSGGGVPSGPLSFMRVYDQIAAVVKSGGKTRRAAKMQSLKDWHPDILEFIQAKSKEEKKARTLIESGKYEANFNGEAYSSIMFQNANLSVRLSDPFMQAVVDDGKWQTHWVTDPAKKGPEYDARYVIREMAEGTWLCGDPGVQYETTINDWHTCPNSGPINASNPCSEYMFLDDTACNLSSINLKKMQKADGTFDVDRFRRAASIYITAQEILVDHASYPTPAIAENSHLFRPLGLGYANLGSMLMSMGIPYDSDAGRGICGALTALLNGQGYLTSSRIASYMGPFKGYKENEEPMIRVMRKHRGAVEAIDSACPIELKDAARQVWDECVASGVQHGFRNAQATVLAPTGTIAFMMDCDTTGIEPDIALVKYKQLAGGGMMKIVNRTVPETLKTIGYDQPKIEGILDYIENNDTIEGAPDFKDKDLPIFDCAFKPANGTRSIAWRAHITMMAAAQPFLSGAISKTVNMPEDSTVEDIEQAYTEGWKLGLKALAIYRDGSKQSQPLNTKKDAEATDNASTAPGQPVRRHLPATRQSVTHKFCVGGHEGYITVGLFEDGSPGELFVTMAKEGSTIGGLMDTIGTQTSLCLQYGVPLDALVDKFTHMRFEPAGWTNNPDIPNAKSVVDYIFRWAGIEFIPGYREANTPQRAVESANDQATETVTVTATATETAVDASLFVPGQGLASTGLEDEGEFDPQGGPAVRSQQFARFQSDAPGCDNCGAITVRNGNCYLCHNCGNSMGCS